MVKALIIDYGHRLTTPGKRTTCLAERVIHERTFNEGYGAVIARNARAAGVEVLEVAPPARLAMNEDADLNTRIKKANAFYVDLCKKHGKDNVRCLYISCHANAGGGQGAEVWVWSKAKADSIERTTARAVVDSLCMATGMKNRGVKLGAPGFSDFAVNRNTTMPAMLIECGFMDYPAEAEQMDNPAFWEKCGNAIFDALCKPLGIEDADVKPTPPSPATPEKPANDGTLYAVQTGAFKNKENAEKHAAEIKAKGFNAVIVKNKI